MSQPIDPPALAVRLRTADAHTLSRLITLEPGDDLQVVGYPDAPDSREVMVTRQGTPVDLVLLSRGSEDWYVSGGDHCSP